MNDLELKKKLPSCTSAVTTNTHCELQSEETEDSFVIWENEVNIEVSDVMSSKEIAFQKHLTYEIYIFIVAKQITYFYQHYLF